MSFLTLGNVLDSTGLVNAGTDVSGDGWTFILGTVMILAVLGVLAMGPRVVRRVLNWMFVPAILGSFVTLFVLLTTSKAEFVSRFNSFMADRADGQTYESILASAEQGRLRRTRRARSGRCCWRSRSATTSTSASPTRRTSAARSRSRRRRSRG